MFMDFLENIVQLLFILIALLASLFRYISSRKTGWLYAVGYFTSSLLSSYFWTTYIVIMRNDPNSSSFLTYFGWNISYLILMLMNLNMKSREERRYFHPLMLLPIPLNAVQLKLYMAFDGRLLSMYQVTVCTVIACFGIQSIMWYLKNRKSGANKPYIAATLMISVCAEFGMWTASCFEGWADIVYYVSSFLCSFTYLLLIWAIRRSYAGEEKETQLLIGAKVQKILKGSYFAIMVTGSLGGILLGRWIKNKLIKSSSDAFDIIYVILFLTALMLAFFVIVIIFIVYFEQKMSENALLREEKLVAERSNAAKSDFLANMSHEIRTPINAVLGMNKMIMRESHRAQDMLPEDRETVKRVFAEIIGYSLNIDSAGNNLLSIINDILDFSKIEAGKMEISERDYNLSSVINDVSNTVMFKAREKGLEYHIETDDDLPDGLYGDDMRIRQIMINVLNNAVKYTDSGSVTLSVHCGHGCKAGEMTELTIEVADTGIGIEKEDLEKIFDKFERTDLKHNSTVEGTGLGLAITHRLLLMMNGSISVQSEYGKGSVFTVKLPQRVTSAEPIGDFQTKFRSSLEESFAHEDILRAPNARVLIVDDTRMNLAVAVGLLKDTEVMTDTAQSGEEALELTLENSYDIIFMDQRMPVMDGTEALHRLRSQENGKARETPVICLTADAISGAKERYIKEGFDDYLSKPIDSRALKKLMLEYLPPEKVIPADEAAEQEISPAAPESSGGIYAAMEQAGVNTAKGLGYCQNIDSLYRMMLQEYTQSSGEKLQDIKRFYDARDAKNYGIVVHSLKSTSLTIGAESVSALAASLEKAADGERWDIISEEHFRLTEKYKALTEVISGLLGDEPESSGQQDEEILEFFPE